MSQKKKKQATRHLSYGDHVRLTYSKKSPPVIGKVVESYAGGDYVSVLWPGFFKPSIQKADLLSFVKREDPNNLMKDIV